MILKERDARFYSSGDVDHDVFGGHTPMAGSAKRHENAGAAARPAPSTWRTTGEIAEEHSLPPERVRRLANREDSPFGEPRMRPMEPGMKRTVQAYDPRKVRKVLTAEKLLPEQQPELAPKNWMSTKDISDSYGIPYPTVRTWTKGDSTFFGKGRPRPISPESKRMVLAFNPKTVREKLINEGYIRHDGTLTDVIGRGVSVGQRVGQIGVFVQADGTEVWGIAKISQVFHVDEKTVSTWQHIGTFPELPKPLRYIRNIHAVWVPDVIIEWGKKPNRFGMPRLDKYGRALRQWGDPSNLHVTPSTAEPTDAEFLSAQDIAKRYGMDEEQVQELVDVRKFGEPRITPASGILRFDSRVVHEYFQEREDLQADEDLPGA
ncbi:hypothetical protein ACFC1T_09100 [Kitasatospora sp. NPDC056076]|uniref:hypothetical protein n=1 Tax=Kitasatospora sp. NPDC056076 TaxID=3345703 RepID=UPI0035E35A2A